MRNVEPDASELLIKALDLAIGASALARYAATHSSDGRLRRLFRQFASTSEHQERILRQQLARAASEPGVPHGQDVAAYVALAVGALAAVAAGLALAARRRGTESGNDGAAGSISRAVRGATASARDLLSGSDGPLRSPGASPAYGSAGGR